MNCDYVWFLMRFIDIWVWWMRPWVYIGQSLILEWGSTPLWNICVSLQVWNFELACINVTFCLCFSFFFNNGATFSTGFLGGMPIRLEFFCGCHVNLFLKNMNSHFGLFWKIHVWQKLTQQIIEKHIILCQKKPVRHIREMSCYHLCTFYILYKKPLVRFPKG